MKLILAILLAFASTVFASTVDNFSLPLNRIETEENFLLQTIQTRTAYRQETIAKTCFRTEFDGYRSVCGYFPVVFCHDNRASHSECQSRLEFRCHQEPQYRNVSYTCYDTVTVPYEVNDHSVRANISVNVNRNTNQTNIENCAMNFSLMGEVLKTGSDCRNQLIVAKNSQRSEMDQFGTVTSFYQYQLNVLDTAATIAPIDGGIEQMQLEGHTLTFRAGDLSRNANYSLNLFVERRHLLKSDETLINRTLSPSEFSFEKINDRFSTVKINLDKLLGGFNDSKKHVIKVEMNIHLPEGTLINNSQPLFSAQNTLTIKK